MVGILERSGVITAAEQREALSALQRYAWQKSGVVLVFLGAVFGMSLFFDNHSVANALIVATLLLGCMDLFREVDLIGKQGRLVKVASGHTFERISILRDTLEDAGIATVIRNERLRSLFTFMAPHLPLELMVAEHQSPSAHSVIVRVDPQLGTLTQPPRRTESIGHKAMSRTPA